MANFERGRYILINPNKYIGDKSNIVYRSRWERLFFKWLDENPKIAKWGSECIVIPYFCQTDRKMHRYFVDVIYQNHKNEVFLIEIKPAHETQEPKFKKTSRKKTIVETAAKYVKNTSKWQAAKEYAEQRGWQFKIFTEDTLRAIGLRI